MSCRDLGRQCPDVANRRSPASSVEHGSRDKSSHQPEFGHGTEAARRRAEIRKRIVLQNAQRLYDGFPLSAARFTLASSGSRDMTTWYEDRDVRTILIVDNNQHSAFSLARMLRLDGHAVRTTSDGFCALRLAQAIRPELVFIDADKPGLNSHELARRIRAEPWGAPTSYCAH